MPLRGWKHDDVVGRRLWLAAGRRADLLEQGIRLRQVDDTVMQLGNQAYEAARTVYASASSRFAGPQLEVAVNQLGKHFGRKPRIAKTAANGNGGHVPPPTTATAAAATSTPTPSPV